MSFPRIARRARHGLIVWLSLASASALAAQSTSRPTIRIGTDSVPASVLGPHLALAYNARNQSPCLDNIPAAQTVRSPVAIQAALTGINDSAGTLVLPQVEFLTSAMADRLFRRLSRDKVGLPFGEPALTWRSAGASLQIVVSKRGTTVVIEPSGFRDDLARMIAEAARDELGGDNPVFFPDGAPGDSTVLRIHTVFPTINESRTALISPFRKVFPFVTFAFPVERAVRQVKEADVAYPAAGPLAEGMLIVRFVVDTTGRVVAGSATDEWPEGLARLRGDAGSAYRRFLVKVSDGLPSGRFEPAAIGGCLVASPVIQRHSFGVRRP